MTTSRYIKIEILGEGTTAVVYRVMDSRLDVEVAMKELKDSFSGNKALLTAMKNEVKLSYKLNHRGICRNHDFREENGRFAVIMDYIPGITLKEWLRQNRSWRFETRKERLEILLCLAEGLAEAHRAGVVHRDLKPGNIILRNGSPGHPIILDFGLAIDVNQRGVESLQGGTLEYMAPEQHPKLCHHLGLEDRTGPQADVFALGIIGYELLAGRRPECSVVNILDKDLDILDDLVPTTIPCDGLPVELPGVISHMLKIKPEKRFFSGDLVYQLLKGIKADSQQVRSKAPKKELDLAFVSIPSGEYLIGSRDERAGPQRLTPQRVSLSGFEIGRTLVTNQEYMEYLDATGRTAPPFLDDARYNAPEQPVVGVTWKEAKEFAEYIGGSLPTEVQWEVAARGKDNRSYPWGDDEPTSPHANIDDDIGKTTPVTHYPFGKSYFGLFDMCGNAWEWCLDYWGDAEEIFGLLSRENPCNHKKSRYRVVKGGAFDSFPECCICSFRQEHFPDDRNETVGFRVVRTKSENGEENDR